MRHAEKNFQPKRCFFKRKTHGIARRYFHYVPLRGALRRQAPTQRAAWTVGQTGQLLNVVHRCAVNRRIPICKTLKGSRSYKHQPAPRPSDTVAPTPMLWSRVPIKPQGLVCFGRGCIKSALVGGSSEPAEPAEPAPPRPAAPSEPSSDFNKQLIEGGAWGWWRGAWGLAPGARPVGARPGGSPRCGSPWGSVRGGSPRAPVRLPSAVCRPSAVSRPVHALPKFQGRAEKACPVWGRPNLTKGGCALVKGNAPVKLVWLATCFSAM